MYQEIFAQSGLSLDRLRTFCMVAQAGGVTKAAGGDANRQSQFSRQIKELEEFFGVDLFAKHGRGVSLTASGRSLALIGHLTLQGLTDFTVSCRDKPVEISIGAGDSLLHWVVVPALEKMRAEFPNVNFVFKNSRTREIVEALQTGLLDFGVIQSDAVPKSLVHTRMGSLVFRLFVPKRLLAPKRPKTTTNFTNLPLAGLEGDGAYSKFIEEFCDSHQGQYGVALKCSSFPLITQAIQDGSCAAILPTKARSHLSEKDFIEIDLPDFKAMERSMSVAWNKRNADIRIQVAEMNKKLPRLLVFS